MRSRTRIFIVAATVALFAALSTAALAVSPHFKKGGEPTCAIDFTSPPSASTTCTQTLAGLGNFDLVATLTTSGTAVYQCSNKGENVAPGQNRVLIGPSSSTTSIPANAIKNGNLTFTTEPSVLTAAATVSAAVAGCPNPNWTGVNPVLTVTNISLTIEQPPGNVIFSCSASDAWTSDTTGIVLSC
jgi:hypothetical protein